MELEELCTFFPVDFWHISLVLLAIFFLSLTKREKEERKRECAMVIHSFISLAVRVCVHICPSSSLLNKRREEKRKKSVSIIIITLLRILSFSILSIYNRIDPLFLCLSLYSLFINSFLSGSRRRRHTFVCWTLTWRNK